MSQARRCVLKTYRILTRLASPLVYGWLKYRQRKGKEDASRFSERLGHAGIPRPSGALAWVHAASVGESMSVVPFIEALQTRYPDLSVLLTTGTVTSARLMESRLPDKAFHQYIPVDTPDATARFLVHWKPELAIFVESELWPNLILETRAHSCPLILLNARLSQRSFKLWQRFPRYAAQLVGAFSTIIAQSEQDVARYKALGAQQVEYIGNLKYFANPLPADSRLMSELLTMIGQRYVWLAASTHPGEEELIAEAHKAIKAVHESVLTIIVPRHEKRGTDIAGMLREKKLTVAQRSADEPVEEETDIYLADTMGELGIFYRLTGIVFMGGTLVEHGGQNPLEPARLNCAILFGPHTQNFSVITAELEAKGGAVRVRDAAALADQVTMLMRDHEQQESLAQKAMAVVEGKQALLHKTLDSLAPWLTPVAGEPVPEDAPESSPGGEGSDEKA